MGRYYSGDIEGKFWFGIQSSNDSEFFGGTQEEPNYITYYFSEDDRKALGKKRIAIDKFFKENNGYNDKMLVKAGIADSEAGVKVLLEWYARLELGQKIYKCLKKQGYCSFEAEL